MKIYLQSALAALFCVCVPFATDAQTLGSNIAGNAASPCTYGVSKISSNGTVTCIDDSGYNSTLDGGVASTGTDTYRTQVTGTDRIAFNSGVNSWARNKSGTWYPMLDSSALANLPSGSGAYDLGTTGALSQTFTSAGTTTGYIISVANGTVTTSTSADSVGGIALSTTSSGPVKVAIAGEAPCYFAGAATQNDIAISNASGQCVDSLVTSSKQLAFGTKVVGKILQTITAAGLANVRVDPVGAIGSGGVPALTNLTNGVLVQSQLPAFAPGSFTAATDQITNHTWTAYVPWGDSITAGNGASVAGNRYVSLIGAKLGIPVTNRGVGSDRSCDTVNHVFNYANYDVGSTTLSTLFVGINDSDMGVGNYETNFKSCFGAAASWLATASSLRTTGSSFTTLPTNWTTDTTYPVVTGLQSSTLGASAVWTTPQTTVQGQSIAIFYRIMDGNGGKFTVSVNDGAAASANNYGPVPIATTNGSTTGVGVILLPNIGRPANTSFNVTTTVASATGSGNVVSILAVGLTPSAYYSNELTSSPAVWVSGPGFEANDLNRLNTQTYYNDAAQIVRSMQEAGIPANWVDTRKFWHGTWPEMAASVVAGDYKHPTDLGETEIANGFLAPTSNVPEQTALIASQIPPSTINGTSCSPSSPCSIDTTAFQSTVANGNATYTLLCNNDAYIYTGGTATVITLPNTCPTYKGVFIFNNGSGNMTFTGNTGGNANTLVLKPNQGAFIMTYGAGSWFTMLRGILGSGDTYVFTAATIPTLTSTTINNSGVTTSGSYRTTSVCALSGTNPNCGSAAAGFVSILAGATTNTISTSAVTANSQILLQFDPTLGTALGVTCNTNSQAIYPTTKNAASGFIVTTSTAPTTNPLCFSYSVVN